MKKLLLAAVAAVSFIPAAAMAQDTAPDGTKAFGIEPYVGVMAGYHNFDARGFQNNGPKGALVQGVAGVNVPLGAFFVGAEGNVAKGFDDIDWEYGVVGRAGFRAGESGMIYGKAGYQWVNLEGPGNRSNEIYGAGVEVGPKDIGLGGVTGNSGIRLRLEVDTVDFNSIRPMAGVIAHF